MCNSLLQRLLEDMWRHFKSRQRLCSWRTSRLGDCHNRSCGNRNHRRSYWLHSMLCMCSSATLKKRKRKCAKSIADCCLDWRSCPWFRISSLGRSTSNLLKYAWQYSRYLASSWLAIQSSLASIASLARIVWAACVVLYSLASRGL